jgi:hypothetical protein
MKDTAEISGPRKSNSPLIGWTLVGALLVGILLGLVAGGGHSAIAADPENDATATREAELVELNDLRTKVAMPVVCTPAASPTPSPTLEPTATLVPAVQVGQEVAYGDALAVTATSIEGAAGTNDVTPNGKYVRVNFDIRNDTDSGQVPPFNEWRLVDSEGNRYAVDFTASAVIVGPQWGSVVSANQTESRGIVFDVAADAGDTFVLESETQPGFRIELTMVVRG